MVTFNELTYRIFNIVKPKISDDESIDILDIQYDVESTRALLLKRRFSNKFKAEIPESIVQPIRRLEITSINASDPTSMNYLPNIPSDKVIMRTVLQVPKIIEKNSGLPLVKRASSATITSSNFTLVTPQHAIYSGNGKFNSKNIFCFYENNYLYFVTNRLIFKALKYVDLYAVFERPTKYWEFMNANYSGAFNDDSAYPISMDMIDDIEAIVIKNKLKIESTQPIDLINDSSDTTKQVQ